MIRRSWTPLAAAAIVAAGCIWAGTWQLDRRAERKARNATTEAAFREEPLPVELVIGDSARRFRRVMAKGQWNYARETVVPGRSRSGSPGVHIVTPMTLDEGGTSILVNRGWVYSPDARSVDLARWHEGDRGELTGYVDALPRALRNAKTALYVVALADSGSQPATATRPARLSAPPFGEQGPHLFYAVQWFSFAAIALIGAPILVRRQRGRRD